MTVRSSHRHLVFAALALLVQGTAPSLGAQRQPARPTRILVLYQQQAETRPMLEFTQTLRATITREQRGPVDFYLEALDLDRVAGREDSAPLAEYYEDKYRDFGIDVVVPVGGRALKFAIDHLRSALPEVPIVFALCAVPQTDPASLPANVTGRLAPPSRFAPTLAMARRLQPDAEQVVVIGGAGPADSVSVSAALRAVAASADRLPVTVLQGMSLDTLLPTLRRLPRRSIVLFANYRKDAQGRVFEPLDIVGSLAHAAPAPMYAQLENYVGEGVLGGSVMSFDEEGVRTGRLVVRVLHRPAGAAMPPVETIGNSFIADWRELQRFDLQESALPRGTRLQFREPTAWERYREYVLVAIGVVIAESVLVGALLIERRRRRRAQALAEEQQRTGEETRRQVAHMGRVSLVGELAAAIAHELRQPLAAIRANAETGVRLLARRGGSLGDEERELCQEIFGAISADDALAADIVTRIRALVRRETLPEQPVQLNEVCLDSVRLLRHEARARKTELSLSLAATLPTVNGDPIQLQQVVLNLIANALDAAAASASPRVVVATFDQGTTVEISVSDNGRGLADNVRHRLFESFFTTKPQGLGLGLAIVKSTVERYRGNVWADNDARGGAVFRATFPAAPSRAVVAPEAALAPAASATLAT